MLYDIISRKNGNLRVEYVKIFKRTHSNKRAKLIFDGTATDYLLKNKTV